MQRDNKYGHEMKAVLGLADGEYEIGEGFGVEGHCAGELVFSTQMTGYMESLTDPSYHGQILMFTFPLIGNYGVDIKNFQHPHVWARGCVVHEVCMKPSLLKSIPDYFEDNGLIGISGIDTRKFTIKIREHGTVRAALVTGCDDPDYAVNIAKNAPLITDEDLIPAVSTKDPYRVKGPGKKIALIDLGTKKNMVKSLSSRGSDIWVYPYNVNPDTIRDLKPDALFVSNGPGDPVLAKDAISCVRSLIGELPIFGICMGHQICALALGGSTYKMKFGHRGTNQPVRNIDGKVAITTQNHGFAVDSDSLPERCSPLYTNLNDGTLEGFTERDLNINCVQFHPEAHGGPRDTEKPFFDSLYRRIS